MGREEARQPLPTVNMCLLRMLENLRMWPHFKMASRWRGSFRPHTMGGWVKTPGGWQEKAKTEREIWSRPFPGRPPKNESGWHLASVSCHQNHGTPVSAAETIHFLVLG